MSKLNPKGGPSAVPQPTVMVDARGRVGAVKTARLIAYGRDGVFVGGWCWSLSGSNRVTRSGAVY